MAHQDKDMGVRGCKGSADNSVELVELATGNMYEVDYNILF